MIEKMPTAGKALSDRIQRIKKGAWLQQGKPNHGLTLRAKILLAFLLVIGAFSALGLIENRLSLRTVYSLAAEKEYTSLWHINREISGTLQKLQDRAVALSGNTSIQKVLREELPDDFSLVCKDRVDFNHMLYYESIEEKWIDGIYVLGENGAMFHATYSFRHDSYTEEDWYQQVVKSRKPLWIPPHAGSFLGNNLDFLTMSIAVPIQDRASTRTLGVMVFEVLLEDVENLVFKELGYEGTFCILDEADQVIYAKGPGEEVQSLLDAPSFFVGSLPEEEKVEAERGKGPENGTLIELKGKRYVAVSLDLSGSDGWKVLCMSPVETVFEAFYRLARLTLIAGLIMVIIWVILAVLFSSDIVRPVKRMLLAMKEVEKGDFSVRVEEGSDELGDLGRGFNHMLGKINALIETERETQEKLKRADFNALQSQINPHFLYNTLDSINWMARMGRTDKVEAMIDSLTSFLRIGLSRGRVFLSLQEEMKHVESYLAIQMERYHSLLHVETQVPEELYGCQMIKMTLQPLVENALYHGIKEKDEPGTIKISAKAEGERLIIQVADDGLGMTKERLSQVQEMMRTGVAQNQDAYGIINVQLRIQSYFGKEYGLNFESEYQKGTLVTVVLPLCRAKEEHV